MTVEVTRPATSSRERRRAERAAVAEALLSDPPPLDDLAPGRVRVLDRAVVHASRSRPVVRWTVAVDEPDGSTRPRRVIGKGYLKGGGREAHRLLHALRAGGLAGPEKQVPRPLGFDPDRALLAQEEAPAGTLHDLIADPGPALGDVRRVGAWLAALHAVTVPGLPALLPTFERDALTGYAERLAAEVPSTGPRVADLVARTLERLPTGAPLVTTHGDFQPKNVHLDDSRVVVIDFDRAALAPAARDLGHFVAQTLTMGAAARGSLDALRPWAEAFLDAYTAAGGSASAVAATPAYVGRTFAEVLFYRLVVRPVPDRSFVPDWLAAWEQSLEAVADVAEVGA